MQDSSALRSSIAPSLATTRLLVDTDRSTASFAVGNFLVRTVTGTMPIVEGWVDLDAAGRPVAAFAALDQTRISTGNTRRDTDLQKPRFLGTAADPLLRWSPTGFEETDGGGWLVAGVLSGRGRTCDLDFAVQVSAAAADGSRGASIVGEFDRRRLGLQAPAVMIGRTVTFEVAAVLVVCEGTAT
jgi:polyisoprenoid-binding protein YceI